MQQLPLYAELACVSNFSFLTGASHPQELVARAAVLGYSALALSDECSMAGVVRALEETRRCAQRGQSIEFIPGSSFRLENGSRLILLPQDHTGYTQLCRLISQGRRNAPKGEYALPDARFERGLDRCLALWLPVAEDDLLGAHWLTAYFPDRCWLGVSLHLGPDDKRRMQSLLATARAAGLPVTACGDAQMHVRSRRMLHDTLAAIRHGCSVADLGYRSLSSGERHLRSRERLAQLFPAELLAQSIVIAQRCRFRLDQLKYRYPREVVPKGMSASAYLRELTEAGIRERWNFSISPELRAQIEKELQLIEELGYESYFLTVYDIVKFARSRGILCQGRGSAANSAVCYCLGITEVDPARMNMLFERFISRERDEPPDIDVDFEHERREEVIQYIYRKYGRDRAALAAAVITYKPRSAIRDVGKALGLPPQLVDAAAKSVNRKDFEDVREVDGLAEPEPGSPVAHLVELAQAIRGFPRHLSIHNGGMIITGAPLAARAPTEPATMPGRVVVQWDKDALEDVGLVKIDLLGLGMLSALRYAFDLVARHEGQRWELHTIPAEDPEVYAMLCRADSVGVFQVESRAQMATLPRLKPQTFYDLVV
ncbi:MAG: PHP domain-containing protein, partial [Xanthomonadales bacterium]|nr:PHP domain-containing protein [Xanthomonadales bacterium]